MQVQPNDTSNAGLDSQVNDLGPLAWVLDELRKSLDSATKALRRFVRDAEQARGSDLATVDSSQLRISRQQLHQAVGALEMVGFTGPALLLRSMEGAVQRFVQRPELCNEQTAVKIERASFALTGYLETVLAGKSLSSVALFPQYSEMQELAGAQRAHPADLWSHPWSWAEVSGTTGDLVLEPDAQTRADFDSSALPVIKMLDAKAAAKLVNLSAGLANATSAAGAESFTTFWRIAAGFFDAVANGLVPTDLHAKRSVSRVLLQLGTHSKGDLSVSDRLAQDLLFFCAQAPATSTAAHLQAVRDAYALQTHHPVEYSKSQFGQYDPSLLIQARKRITAAKESWTSVTSGDTTKFKTVSDQFSLIADSLSKLMPNSATLSQSLVACIESTAKKGQAPDPSLAMEVATAVLYIEAGFEEFTPNDPAATSRMNRLAQRLDATRSGGRSEPLEVWMEELYRKVSDRQTMGSVVGELKMSLGELEKSMDQFFRDPEDKVSLTKVPARLSQMRGVLSVLGLDHASQTVLKMRESIEQILETEIDVARARATGTFEKLGNNLGALGFLIDMLSYQPVLAKKLFVFDEAAGELKPLMGRAPGANAAGIAAHAVPAAAVLHAVGSATVSKSGVAAAAEGIAATAAGLAVVNKTKNTPAVAVVDEEDDGESELRDIFLEEAREVIAQGQAALAVLAVESNNLGEMTSLRRAFHTLKGSSRMVGLNAFGEAGWSLEQMLNSWLADQKPASDALLTTASQGLAGLAHWVQAIEGEQDAAWSPAPFKVSADALRTQGLFVALDLTGVVQVNSTQAVEPTSQQIPVTQLPAPAIPATEDFAQNSLQADAFFMDTPVVVVAATVALALDETPATDLSFDLSDEVSFDLGESAIQESQSANELDVFDEFFDESLDGSVASADADALLIAEYIEEPMHEGVLTVSDPSDQTSELLISAEELAAFEAALNAQESETQTLLADAFREGATEVKYTYDGSATMPAQLDGSFAGVSTNNISSEPLMEFADFDASLTKPAPVSTPPSPSVTAAPFDTSTVDFTARSSDDQFKVIGPMRISLPLYNVYLNEADEWSRRLVTCLAEWSIEPHSELPAEAEALAHSLAGSSATVGFSALSTVARTLEHSLQHAQVSQEAADVSVHTYAQAYVGASEEIRRLLHQFAAGLLKEPEPAILAALERSLAGPDPETEFHSITVGAETLVVSELPGMTGEDAYQTLNRASESVNVEALYPAPAQVAATFTVQPVQEAILTPLSTVTVIAAAAASTLVAAADRSKTQANVQQINSPHVELLAEPKPETKPSQALVPAALPLTVQALAVAPRILSDDETEDEIDAIDAIDEDLFPIFEEEAAELFPQMGGSLRQWISRPGNTGARAEVLRGLHTLKGSARLAGALRLGEMAHRMESTIEHIGELEVNSAALEPLMHQLDGMQGNFDRLRHPASQVQVQPQAQISSSPASVSDALTGNAIAPEPVGGAFAGTKIPANAATASAVALQATRLTVNNSSSMLAAQPIRSNTNQSVRVRSQLLDRLVNQAGEVMITRSRLEAELGQLRGSLGDLTGNLDKLRGQLRDIEVQAESQMQSRMALAKESNAVFDPLEFDRFTRVQELTRMMAESVNDVATVQRNIQRTVEATEDDLVAQARQTRELQRDLLRTRMVEFEGISDRLYRVVRQAGKDAGKQVKLDITGGSIEMDRGVLDRMTPAFEHLLRNCVAHGIESAEARVAAGKEASGQITISLHQEGNDVSVEFRDDGAGLNLPRIRERALAQGLLSDGQTLGDGDAASLIFTPGFTTATQITELSGRGIGMDVVRSEVNALGGRIETTTAPGQGTNFKLVLPLTTAVTQVVMLRIGNLSIGVPANLIEIVRRAPAKEVEQAYNSGVYEYAGEALPFFWSGALLQHSRASNEPPSKTMPVAVFRSAAQRVVAHIDEVLGNQEVVVKNLGPQLARLPGLAGMSVLASGAVVLIYNPVALATVYGQQARALSADKAEPHVLEASITDDGSGVVQALVAAPPAMLPQAVPQAPLVLVVDDSITVRRVTQRLLQREGYRVALAADGLLALERLAEELPAVVLSDIEMPRMDGFDLVRNIKADPRLAHLPIITITSRIAEKHRDHAMALGVNHYLGKPYSEEELLSLIKRYAAAEAVA